MSLTSGEVARELGTTVPRVLRAARKGLVPTLRRGERTLFPSTAVDRLRQRWGWAPKIDGLSREEVFVLAALGRRPFGLRSTRAVARAAGTSATTAGRALRNLVAAKYVERVLVRVTEGEVRDVSVWRVRWEGQPWLAVAGAVGATILPERQAAQHRGLRIPARLGHLFWNEDLAQLDITQHGVLIANRILRSEDLEALAWMVRAIEGDAIRRATNARGMPARCARLGQLLAEAP
ncbi:MAG: MarR family transcriptional regulator [Actinomycetota bacterium]